MDLSSVLAAPAARAHLPPGRGLERELTPSSIRLHGDAERRGTATSSSRPPERRQRFYLASTVWVYTALRTGMAWTRRRPSNLNGAGTSTRPRRWRARWVCHNYGELYGVPFTVLRYASPTARDARGAPDPRLHQEGLAGEPLTVTGKGRSVSEFRLRARHAEAHLARDEGRGANQTYNLEARARSTVLEVAEGIRSALETASASSSSRAPRRLRGKGRLGREGAPRAGLGATRRLRGGSAPCVSCSPERAGRSRSRTGSVGHRGPLDCRGTRKTSRADQLGLRARGPARMRALLEVDAWHPAQLAARLLARDVLPAKSPGRAGTNSMRTPFPSALRIPSATSSTVTLRRALEVVRLVRAHVLLASRCASAMSRT